MLRGLWRLTWLETKIFLREPLGAISSILLPGVAYVLLGRILGRRVSNGPRPVAELVLVAVPVLSALLIALTTVISLITIVAIYREGGILKRLRATPLRSWTILTAHVVVKLLFTVAALLVMVLAGRRFYPPEMQISLVGLAIALLITTLSIMTIGFVIASLVPNARFVQPVAGAIFYPMIAVSGLFYPIAALPPSLRAVARVLPLTYAVSLLRGVVEHEPWPAHLWDVAALVIYGVVFVALSAKVFRWE